MDHFGLEEADDSFRQGIVVRVPDTAWYSIEQYWLPLTPFCLSSGDTSLVDLLLPLAD
jgi:hypothetical protein